MEATVAKEMLTDDDAIKKIDELNSRAWEVHITQPKQGLDLGYEAKELSEKYSYQKGLAYALRNMGVSNRYLSNLETALSLSMQALDMFIQLNENTGEAQAYISIGAIYYYMGDYERGLDYFLKGLKHNEEIGNKEAQAYALNGAGYIYSTLGNNKKGIELLQQALTLSREVSVSPDLQPRVLDSMATVYFNDDQMDKAYETFNECLQLSEKSSQKVMRGDALFGIGRIFLRQKQLEDSKKYFLMSLSTAREIGYKVGEADCLLQLGKVSFLQEDAVQAEQFIQESLKVAEEIKAKAIIYMAHEALAELYEQKNDIKSFVTHYKLFHKYKSEVFKEEQESKQKYLNIQNEMEKLQQEAEINRLTNVVMKEKNEELEKKTDELQQSYNSVSVLSQIGKEITSTLNLDTILNTVYEKVNELMDANIFGIGIYNSENKTIDYRLAIENGVLYQPYQRTMENKNQFPVWCIENNKEVFINDVRKEYSNYISEYIEVNATLEDGSETTIPSLSLIYLPLTVKDKVFGLLSVQSYNQNAYSQYHLDILKTLASYTAAALYNAQSFQTLQNTVNELKLTQQQLIQSEKMASLGELTAGIAHEIQNPLNFVNNFSEISRELIEELKDERSKAEAERKTGIEEQLLNDISQNLEKINHHGKRADAIVKGMLQHSRSSTGKKELTDINVLADEYLRLSYHGLRAKNKSFNAKFETDFDEGIGMIETTPQDIGRVLLNLFTNAFYSVTEKKNLHPDNFEPAVSVVTKKENGKIVVKVKDNGMGIPQKVLDKIYQPFFTTKPTGQGTGLGLSMSYDIIKAHGGELKVETSEGEFAEFVVILPIN